MKVQKRNNELEEVSFDKIKNRIAFQTKDLNIDHIVIAQKVISRIYDGVKTSELDELTAQICTSLATENLDYGMLASRIIISNNHKNTSPSFSEVIHILYNNSKTSLISEDVYNVVIKHKKKLNSVIDYSRDYNFDYFSYKTLERAYLMKVDNNIVERIQHLFMRVSIGLHLSDIKSAIESYHYMSQKYFTHATPTLFHAGTPKPQLLSCFLLGTEDSVSGMYKNISDCAQISKWAGGIGVHISNIRSKNSLIRSTNGKSNGLIPMLRVYNECAKHINQCFTPDTKIYTKTGVKNIEDITERDFVITKDGSYKKVLEVIKNHTTDTILKIRTTHSIEDVKCTKVHEIFALCGIKKMTPFSTIKHKLLEGIIEPEFVSAEDLNKDTDFLVFPIPTDVEDVDEYDKDLCRFYGIMLGDGHITKKKNCNSYECGITCGTVNKKDTLTFIRNFLQKRNIHSWENEHTNCIAIKWTLSTDFDINYDMLYNKEHQKYIHPSFINLPKQKLLSLILGLIETDGSRLKEIYYSSTSRELVEGLRIILLKCGVLTSGNIKNNIGSVSPYKNITTKQICYSLRIPKHPILESVLNITPSKKLNFFEYNNLLFSRVRSIESCEYDGYVYDLNIEDNHNYLTHMGLVHNSGKRNGSIAFYLEPHHPEIIEFLQIRKNHGNEDDRCRDLFSAMWISDLFMERVKADATWSLFDPDVCPKLTNVCGDEYKELYETYEKEKLFTKQLPARDVWKNILDAQIETGTPYIGFKDNVNRKTNQQNLGTIKSSNLCIEINEYSDENEYACCTLASLSLSSFVKKKEIDTKFMIYGLETGCTACDLVKMMCKNNNYEYEFHNIEDRYEEFFDEQKIEEHTVPQIFIPNGYIGGYQNFIEHIQPEYDFTELKKVVKIAIKNLNKVIDLNYYPVPETKLSNMKHRPLGLGVQGLADTYAKMRFAFDSDEALQLNKDIFETIYYAALDESSSLAKKEGVYSSYEGSPISKGIYQFDMWGVKPSTRHDWIRLKKKISKYGIRNSLLTALMPTASTSQIMGNNECFEPFTSNIYSRRTIAGDFIIINKYLIKDLTNLGMWNNELKNQIIANNGSVQDINIPKQLKELYKTVWEIKQKVLIQQSADRGAYVCQAQSLNLFFEEPTHGQLTGALFYGWEKGLKTGSYYIRTRPKTQAQQFTVDPKYKVCESCSG